MSISHKEVTGLAQHKSAIKRMRQDKKRRERNRAAKSAVKRAVKKVPEASSPEDASRLLSEASSVIDRAAKKGVIHWKKAARKKSRLAKQARSVSG
jgi:small subunit ribosomal protein S20